MNPVLRRLPYRALWAGLLAAVTAALPAETFTIDAREPVGEPERGYFRMGTEAGARAPDGAVLTVTSRSLELDGRPWFPVMGEFHYSRCPAAQWEEELLKMKAGGIQVVATYVFWIHHEEVEGAPDWSGDRDLRRFVALCHRHGLRVWLRLGPWCHGEVRNGGLPDWLLAAGPVRVNDPAYLARVAKFYGAIAGQVRGLLWRDGGPVAGVQLENEYNNRSAAGGPEHIARLKQLALAAGLDVPVYTVTGWDNTVYPPREVVPVFGGYPDAPWSDRLDELPPDRQGVYQFAPAGGNTGILQGAPGPAAPVDLRRYPRFTAELGPGVQVTYHRRVRLDPVDVPPLAISALGSGVTLLGYYMYHGGLNPDGVRTTLQESQDTGYPNDVPVKSYDFQAPLGAHGQVRESYRKLKVIHRFVADFGGELATTARFLPDRVPANLDDTTTLRVAARLRDGRGFLFFNNYVRRHALPRQHAVQVVLHLPGGEQRIPAQPVDVPAQTSFFWPVNLPLGTATLASATVQPVARWTHGDTTVLVTQATPGIDPELVFACAGIAAIEAPGATLAAGPDGWRVTAVPAGLAAAVALRTTDGRRSEILVLSPAQAENLWEIEAAGRPLVLLTAAEVFSDGQRVHLRARRPEDLAYALWDDGRPDPAASVPVAAAGSAGRFRRFVPAVAPRRPAPVVVPERPPGDVGPVPLGPPASRRGKPVAAAPGDAAFAAAAARWRVELPPDARPRDWLVIEYVGDATRLTVDGRLVLDDFYHGRPLEIPVGRLPPAVGRSGLELQVLPLRRDAPIYLPAEVRPDFGDASSVARLVAVRLEPEYEVTLTPLPEPPGGDAASPPAPGEKSR